MATHLLSPEGSLSVLPAISTASVPLPGVGVVVVVLAASVAPSSLEGVFGITEGVVGAAPTGVRLLNGVGCVLAAGCSAIVDVVCAFGGSVLGASDFFTGAAEAAGESEAAGLLPRLVVDCGGCVGCVAGVGLAVVLVGATSLTPLSAQRYALLPGAVPSGSPVSYTYVAEPRPG